MSYPILYGTAHYPAIAGIAVASVSVVNDTTERADALDTNTLGLGVLTDAISCTVTEERNGSYELKMEYPMTGVHFSEIELRSLLLAKPNYTDDPQIFRIYKITKPLNGRCTIYAQHISYDLSGLTAPAGLSASSLALALDALQTYAGKFNLQTTRTGSATFSTDIPASVRSWLGGKTGSILDLYGGEWHFDNYTCTLSTERGADRGVTIRYGKNLTTLTQNIDCSAIYSEVTAYYKDVEGNVIQGAPVSTGLSLDAPKALVIDASQKFDSVPSIAQLTSYARKYVQNNELATPKVNITLDFAQLKGLSERVDLCDTVSIEFEALGVSAQAKCIKTVWDCLKERYTSSTFGTAKTTLSESITAVSEKVVNDNKSWFETAIVTVTSLVTGNKGGCVVFHDSDDDGKPDEILIMDTEDINTATKVWRWNLSGLGYSSTGYGGPFGLAMTIDGQIVADFITAGTMTANHIKGGTLTLGGDNNSSGVLQILNASGIQVGYWDRSGIKATSGNIASLNITDTTLSYGDVDTPQDGDSLLISHGALALSNGETITVTQSGGYKYIKSAMRTSLAKDGLLIKRAESSDNTWAGASYRNDVYAKASVVTDGTTYARSPLLEFLINSSSALRLMSNQCYVPVDTLFTGSKVEVNRAFYAYGTKSRVVETEDYSDRLLYCYETPTPMFGDIGEGVIGDDGQCYVWIESIFAETIAIDQYQVSLQKYGEGDCYVAERKGGYFLVKGTPGLAFGWELKAKQIDYSQRRLDTMINEPDATINYGELANEYITNLKEERIA